MNLVSCKSAILLIRPSGMMPSIFIHYPLFRPPDVTENCLSLIVSSTFSDFLKVCDNAWFIIGTLCRTLSIVWGIFDIHDVSGVGSTPVSGWLVVMILTLFPPLLLMTTTGIEVRSPSLSLIIRGGNSITTNHLETGEEPTPKTSYVSNIPQTMNSVQHSVPTIHIFCPKI
jgi:hypothetical protein